MQRHLLWPFHATPLVLVATFTFGLLLAAYAGLAGLALGVVLLSWFFKYCFVLLDAMIAGDEEPPVLSVEMVNPFDEQRPLVQALVLIAAGMLLLRLQAVGGRPLALAAGTLLLGVLPANVALLGISRNPFYALYPPALAGLIRGLGWHYAALLAAVLLAGALSYGLWQLPLPLGVQLAASQLACLLAFAFIGAAVHENRLALGLETRSRPERKAERERRDHEVRRRHMLDHSYAQLRLRRTEQAWGEIEGWLNRECRKENTDIEHRALLAGTARWSDASIGDRVASRYLALLLARGDNGRAVEVAEERLAVNPRFHPTPESLARRLAELAALAGKRALSRRLQVADRPTERL